MRPFRVLIILVLLTFAIVRSSSAAVALSGSDYLARVEGVFGGASQTYAVPLNLSSKRRLVVGVAAQFAIDFGIIPAADFKKWKRRENPRYLFRLAGETNTRYVTLNAGSYYVVARDLNAGAASNGFSFKVRPFNGSIVDRGVTRIFVSNQVANGVIAPRSWNGFAFSRPTKSKMRIEGIFSRGLDRQVHWEIVSEAEYQKFLAGRNYQVLLTGAAPKQPAFEFTPAGGPFYFLYLNRGTSYSAYSVTRELYR